MWREEWHETLPFRAYVLFGLLVVHCAYRISRFGSLALSCKVDVIMSL